MVQTGKPEVLGSIPIQDQALHYGHDNLFCVSLILSIIGTYLENYTCLLAVWLAIVRDSSSLGSLSSCVEILLLSLSERILYQIKKKY